MINATRIQTVTIIETPQQMNANGATASTLLLGYNGDWWDFWMLFSIGLVALVAAAVGAFTVGSVMVHKREAAAASAELERYKSETAGKVAEATTAGIAAGEKAGHAQTDVDAAKVDLARQEALTAGATAVAAKATERAAEANLKAENLHRQNLELEKAVSPRILEQNLTAQQLRPFSDVAYLVISPPDFEPKRTAGQIRFMLWQAGWSRLAGTIEFPAAFFDGVIVHATVGAISRRPGEAADALIAVLNNNGIVAKRGPSLRELGILVEVGPKPLPPSLQLKPEGIPSDESGGRTYGNILEP